MEVAPRRLPPRCRPHLMAVRAGLQPAAPCSRSPAEEFGAGAFERSKGRDDPSGGILDVVTLQPYLLSRAGESAQEGDKPGVGRVCCGVPRDSVVGDAEALVVRLVQTHVDPSEVLQVPFLVGLAGAFFQQGIDNLVVDMLLL